MPHGFLGVFADLGTPRCPGLSFGHGRGGCSAVEVGAMTGASENEAREFAAAFRSFLNWVHSDDGEGRARNEVVVLLGDFLGEAGREMSVVTRQLPAFEHVNLQTALEEWIAEPGRTVTVQGITVPPHFGPITLQQLVTGEGIPPLRLSAPSLVD